MAIDDVESWLIVEITSTMPRREAIVGVDAEAFLEDLDKLLAKVRQIDSSISLIRADETALTGHATRPRRFLPVLVCTEGFPVNPITMSELERRCDAESLLQGDDVQGLRLLTHEDLEAAEALMETHGVSLSALLEDHANSSLRAMDLRSYILASRNPIRLRPTRLDEATDAAFESLMSRVGRDQSDDAATP